MFRVIVKRPGVAVGKKGYRKQPAGIFLVDKDGVVDDFPTRFDVFRGPDDQDYPPGEYTMSPASITVQSDKYGSGQITISRVQLIPNLQQATRKPAAA